MILSETELGLGDDAARDHGARRGPGARHAARRGAAALRDGARAARSPRTGPDCLAVYGVAREVHAVTGGAAGPLDESEPPAEGAGRGRGPRRVEVASMPDLCPRYMARVLPTSGRALAALAARTRLEAAGMRPISNVVDITNYVMLLDSGSRCTRSTSTGWPAPASWSRRAREGERIVTLDGVGAVLDPSMLAICDAERPAVIAGHLRRRVRRGARGHDAGAAGGGDLRRPGDPRRPRCALGPAERVELALREGPAPRAAAAGDGDRRTHAGRALRRAAWCPGTLDAQDPAPGRPPVRMRHAARAAHARASRCRPRSRRPSSAAWASPSRRGTEALAAEIPFERGARPDPRDRPDRGGRAHPRPGRHPGRAAARGAAAAGRSPAQALQRRLARLAADLGLSEAITYRHVPEADPTPCACARRPAPRPGAPGPPDERRDGRDAPLDAAGPAAAGRAQPGPPARRRRAVRDRPHLRAAPDGLADERGFLAASSGAATRAEGWRAAPRPADVSRRHRPGGGADRRRRRRGQPRPNAAPLLPPRPPGAPGRRGGGAWAGPARSTRSCCARST